VGKYTYSSSLFVKIVLQIVHELEEMVSCGFGDHLGRIKSAIGTDVQTALLSRVISNKSYLTCQKLLAHHMLRVTSDESLLECSTCIYQNVHVVVSEEKKLQKVSN
jgi:superfamily II DNA/RNA helicase